MNRNNRPLFLLWLMAAASLAADPPPVPAAGIVERELEKEYEPAPLEQSQKIPEIRIDIPQEHLEIPTGKKIWIQNVIIQGNDSISEQEILLQVQRFLGKELSLQEIYELCYEIDKLYAEQGYFLARAYPPPQDIENGTLRIEILEGKLGNIQVTTSRYYSEEFIKSYLEDLKGKPLRDKTFLRALMLLNENSDLFVSAIFEKGKEFGYADVILQVDESRPVHLYLNGNNYGRSLTTNARAGGRFDWGNLITQGDTFSVAEVMGFPMNALYFTDATYSVPLNRKGTIFKGEYLFSKFKVEEMKRLRIKGISNIATVKVTQACMRTRSLRIDAFSSFDYKQIQNYDIHGRTSFDKLRVLTIGALFDHVDVFRARNYCTVQVAGGIPDFLGGLKPVDRLSSRKGGGGRFFILNVDYDRLQPLPKDCSLHLHGSGQLTPSKLTVPEQLYIGGMDTVRGFPLAAALGDNGYYANLELMVPPPVLGERRFFKSKKKWKEVVQLEGFVDQGGAFLQSEKNTVLWGSGVGIRLYGPHQFTFSLDVGFPLNHRDLTRSAFFYIKVAGKAF